MKSTIKKIFIACSGFAFFAACKQQFLDTHPLNQIPAATTWADGGLSEAFVTNIYSGLGNGGFDEQQLSALSDEAVFVHPGRGINTINEGTLNPSNLGWVSGTYEWGSMYFNIREANVALENLKTATFSDTVLNHRLQGEAHFLRAYFYHQLVRYYGGVPLIARSYGLHQDYSIARSSFFDCVKFITADCDTALSLLTGKSLAKGRATAVSALALKSRILLYAASDLHDIPTAKANSPTVIGAYANPELLGYTGAPSDPDRTTRWKAAKDAAQAVLMAGGGYNLGLSAPASSSDAQASALSIAMGGGSNAPGVDKAAAVELLFERDFSPQAVTGGPGTDGTSVGLDNGPNGYHNWAGNAPVQQLVDDYEMMDGTKFDWGNGAEAAAPYKNRDPRLYATILFDGAGWKPRSKITSNPDPANQIQTGQYQIAGTSMQAGLDTRQSPVENWNGTWTGYYMRKFIDPDPNVVDNNTRQYIPWPFFRYTEAVLNYVEACIELGDNANAQTWLNKIRYRAGMPATMETGDALRQRYRNERRVELAYEEHRYHDARRWMIAANTLGRKNVFINVTGMLMPAAIAPSPYRHDETLYTYTYKTYVDISLENRTWLDKMYFRPIALSEINTNSKLTNQQNPGY